MERDPVVNLRQPFCTADITIEDDHWQEAIADLQTLANRICQRVLDEVKLSDHVETCEVSFVFTDNPTIRGLNNDYRGKDSATNVLSFPCFDVKPDDYSELSESPAPVTLGDIIIAYDVVKQEAKKQGKRFEDHVNHLLIHGLLHLLGYDHIDDDDAKRMEALEIAILDKLGIKNPYI